MLARHAARLFALLLLFQLEESSQGDLPEASQLSDADLLEKARHSCRLLVELAKDKLESAASRFQATFDAIETYEFEHPSNLENPIEKGIHSVPLKQTKETAHTMQECLQAIEWVWETLETPYLLEHLKNPTVVSFMTTLVQNVLAYRVKIDVALNRHSPEWKVERMVKLDRCVLRMSVAEMVCFDNIDLKVSINEAIELAKQFSLGDSYRFINGVLGAVAKDLEQNRLHASQWGHQAASRVQVPQA
jgi:transcription antitermination protein NusB